MLIINIVLYWQGFSEAVATKALFINLYVDDRNWLPYFAIIIHFLPLSLWLFFWFKQKNQKNKSRFNTELAAQWLIEHIEDPNLETPLSQPDLRAIARNIGVTLRHLCQRCWLTFFLFFFLLSSFDFSSVCSSFFFFFFFFLFLLFLMYLLLLVLVFADELSVFLFSYSFSLFSFSSAYCSCLSFFSVNVSSSTVFFFVFLLIVVCVLLCHVISDDQSWFVDESAPSSTRSTTHSRRNRAERMHILGHGIEFRPSGIVDVKSWHTDFHRFS